MKILKFSDFQFNSGPRGAKALLTIKFMDGQGDDVYSWMPTWHEVEQLFLKSINTEYFNKPESEFLPRFANIVRQTAEGVNQSVQGAYKVSGKLAYINDDGKLVIGDGKDVPPEEVTPLFPLSIKFCDEWIDEYVEVLVVNDVAVQISRTDRHNWNERVVYPLPETADDLDGAFRQGRVT